MCKNTYHVMWGLHFTRTWQWRQHCTLLSRKSVIQWAYFETSTSYILAINESMLKTLNLKTVFRRLQFRYESLKLRDCYEAPNRTVCKMLHTLGKNQYIFGLTILLGPSAKSLSTSRPFSWFLYNRSDFRLPLLHYILYTARTRLALRSAQLSIQWVPGFFSRE